MAPGMCEKPLLEANEGLSQHRLLQERGTELLRTGPPNNIADGCLGNEHIALNNLDGSSKEDNDDPLVLLIHPPDDLIKDSDTETTVENGNNRRETGEGEGGGGGGRGGGGREPENGRRKQSIDKGILKRGWFHRYRDLMAYWWLGFCNNFTYWVMITAAYDLLTPEFQAHIERSQGESQSISLQPTEGMPEQTITNDSQMSTVIVKPSWENDSAQYLGNTFECQEQSTGVILVADTLPATALTLAAPLTLLLPVSARVWLVSLLCGASYLTLGLAHSRFIFLGVALASASRGFSDSTFLGHASHYPKNVLSLWSSGTGVATFIGPLLYSSLTTGGLDPRHALLVFLTIPAVTVVSFWCLLSRYDEHESRRDVENPGEAVGIRSEQDLEKKKLSIVIQEKLILFMRAQKYIFPLGIFYFVMYFTNQGLLELVYFPSSVLTHAQQYSWSNTIRCLGTLISRSAHTVMLFPSAWIYNAIALTVLILIGSEAYYHYMPSEYIIFTLLLIQGLCEGSAFRTCVFKIHNKTSEKDRAFCLGVFPASLFLPALLAGLISMPVHDALCKHHAFKA